MFSCRFYISFIHPEIGLPARLTCTSPWNIIKIKYISPIESSRWSLGSGTARGRGKPPMQRQNTPNRQMRLKAINSLSSHHHHPRHLYRPSPRNRSTSTTSSPANSIVQGASRYPCAAVITYYYSILNRYAGGCSLAVCKVGCSKHDKVAALNN